MIQLSEFPEHLKTIKQNDWRKLFDLINDIEKTKKFSDLGGGEKLGDGSVSFSYYIRPSEIVDKFFDIVHDLDIAPVFDWMDWKEGKKILMNKRQDFTQLDTITLCKLLTTIIRADRFTEGYMVSCFENGIITKIIGSLKSKTQDS